MKNKTAATDFRGFKSTQQVKGKRIGVFMICSIGLINYLTISFSNDPDRVDDAGALGRTFDCA
jgi:hypothetical protein